MPQQGDTQGKRLAPQQSVEDILMTDEEREERAKAKAKADAGPKPKTVTAPSAIAAKRQEAARTTVREVLSTLASTPAIETGAKLHPEDRSELIKEALADLGKVPPRVQAEARATLNKVLTLIESGNRGAAIELAREQAQELGSQLGDVPGYEPPAGESPEELAAQIPRA